MLPVTAHAQNWQTVPSMKEVRIDHTATPLPDGRVLVPGGATSQVMERNGLATPSAEVFDPGH